MIRSPEAEKDMHRKGYALAGDIAAALGIQRSTVTRWADDGKVREIRYLSGRYIEVASVVKHMSLDGDAAARLRFAVLTTDKRKQVTAKQAANEGMAVVGAEGGDDGDTNGA